jgi:hypothetical protein
MYNYTIRVRNKKENKDLFTKSYIVKNYEEAIKLIKEYTYLKESKIENLEYYVDEIENID